MLPITKRPICLCFCSGFRFFFAIYTLLVELTIALGTNGQIHRKNAAPPA